LHRHLTEVITVAEGKDPIDPSKTSLILVSINQGSMSIASAKGKDGNGNEDFYMDSALMGSNIYVTSQA